MNPTQLPASINSRAAPAVSPPTVDLSRPLGIAQAEPALSLLEVVLRHRKKLILCVAAALFLGAVYQLLAPRKYEAAAEVFVQRSRDGQSNSPLSSGGLASGLPSTHASVMESIPVLRAALEKPEVAGSLTLAGVEGEAKRLKFLKKSLQVGFSKEKEIVSVAFTGRVKKETALIVNAVLDAYQQRLRATLLGVDVQELAGIESEPTGLLGEKIIAGRLERLGAEQTSAQMAREAASVRVQQARDAGADIAELATLLEDAGISSGKQVVAEVAYLQTELLALERNLESMPPSWGPSHTVRGPVQRQADAIRYELTRLQVDAAAVMHNLLESDLHNAERRAHEMEQSIADQQRLALRVAPLPIERIEEALVPDRKASPRGLKTAGVSVFLGLFFGVCWILWVELKEGGVAAVSAAAPGEPVGQGPLLLAGTDMAQEQAASTPLLGMIPEVPTGRRLTTPNFDATASSIHQIRAVLQVHAGSNDAKAFAFTSPRRGAGKTSVTIGVASSLAMSGTRTLVVDCDLAGRIARGQTGGPSGEGTGLSINGVHDRFGPLDLEGSSPENASIDNIVIEEGYISDDDKGMFSEAKGGVKVGVTGMLDGGSLSECCVEATVPGLSLLPAVHAQPHHIGMMSDAFVRRLIEEAQGTYDLVLFDTGPVPGSVEALLVTSQVDGVVVVVPQGETRQALSRTMSYLKVVGAEVFGTVFNRASDAPEPGQSPAASTSLAGAAATASAAAATRTAKQKVGDSAPLIELDRDQRSQADSEFLAGGAPLGSGILAAAVFSDADSAFSSEDWQLEETSEFNGSVEELFGKAFENGEQRGDG